MDQSYAIEVTIEDVVSSPFVVFQAGILYTSCVGKLLSLGIGMKQSFLIIITGERRIRVVTLALPTTASLSGIYSSVDQVALASFLANKAVERAVGSKLEDARDAVQNKLVDILTAYKGAMTAGGAGAQASLAISENMKMLPLLMLGVLKHVRVYPLAHRGLWLIVVQVGIRQSANIPSDMRAYAHALLTSLPTQLIIPYLHPNFYSLHDMPPEAGTVGEHGIIMPPLLPLSSEKLSRHGLFLIEDGQSMFLWMGRDAVPQLVQDVFGIESYERLVGGKVRQPTIELM